MHADQNSAEVHQKEQLARFLWTGFILMFFGIQAIIWTIAILMTSNDSSHAVVRYFNAKTALPPSAADRARINQTLGWKATLKVLPASADRSGRPQGQAEVELTLSDKTGAPLELAFVDLSVFHCAQAAKVQQVKLSPQQPGLYRGMMQIHQAGQWQFDGVLQRDQETYFLSERLSLQR